MSSTRVEAGLSKAERILKSRRFRWVLRRGVRFFARSFTLVAWPATVQSKLGLTVSRKVGSSVERNRVKRLVRECFRLHKYTLPRPMWLVVIARPGAPDLSYEEVCRQLLPVLVKSAKEVSDRPTGSRPARRS